jgi:hydrogenase expression/formation protein HypC
MCLAVPGRIIGIIEDGNLGLRHALVDFGGIRKEVCLDYTPGARIGDYVLVHVGFAVTVVDEDEASRVFEALRELDQLEGLQESTTPCSRTL